MGGNRRKVVVSSLLAALISCCSSGSPAPADGGIFGWDGGSAGDGGATGVTCESGGTGPTTSPVSYAGAFPTTAGEHDTTLSVAGLNRAVFVYVPAGLGSSPPLLVVLHGTGAGSETGQGRDMASNFQPMADAHGIVLVGPESRVLPDADWDQHSGGEKYWETIPADDPSRGCDPSRNPDLLLVRAIIQEAKRAFGIDPRRVYVVGHSNGGFFSLSVAVALRDQIAAFAELSAGLVRCDNTNSCSFAGTSTTCAGLGAEAQYCSCSGGEKPIRLPITGRMPPASISHGNQDYTVSVFYGCELAARMAQLGHSATVTIRAGADHEMPDFTAPAAYGPLWTFFEQHPLPP